MDITHDINALLTHARQEILRVYNAESCIVSTRVAVDVMRQLGYEAYPQPVSVVICNPAMTQKMEEVGGWPKDIAEFDEWTANLKAWNVSLGRRRPGDTGFVCHLVAIVNKQILIDLSLDQASRAQWQMNLYPFASMVPPAFFAGEPFVTKKDGMLIIYEQTMETSWRLSPNWVNRQQYGPVVDAVLRRIKG